MILPFLIKYKVINMSLLAGLSNTKIEVQADSLGGFSTLPHNVYSSKVKMAYLDTAASGTICIKFEFEVTKEDGQKQSIKENVWISHAGGAFEKDGKPAFGLGKAEGIFQLTTGKGINEQTLEKKMVKVFEDGKEQHREKEVFTDIIGENIAIGILDVIKDKQAKNNQTGKYEATGETRNENELHTYFDADTFKTYNEKKDGKDAEFVTKWKEKYVGKDPINKAKGKAAGGAVQGKPSAGATPSAGGSLFGN